MTADAIIDYISARGMDINNRDMAKLNEMLFELPLDEVSEVRAWAFETIALYVNDPVYAGDVPPIE